MRRSRFSSAWAAALTAVVLFLPASAVSTASAGTKASALRLHRCLPKDPLLVFAMRVEDPAAELAGLLDTLGRFSEQGAPAAAAGGTLEGLEAALTVLLPRELMDSIGPEIAVAVDMPPIDDALGAIQASGAKTLDPLLGRAGLLADVRDAKRLDAALRLVLSALGGSVTADGEGGVHARLDMPNAPELNVHYVIRKDRLALGFSHDWVAAAIEGQPSGQRLADGQDFSRVFAQLDSAPTNLTYVNLPKVRDLVVGSRLVQSLAGSDAEVQILVERFFTDEAMGVGLGLTSVASDHGVRTSSFGPPWMSGAVMSSSMLTAMVLPGLMSAVDTGRAHRTVGDIQAIAQACEGFSADSAHYPGPTEGWVPVESLAAYLEPVYIRALPRQDAWANPLLYWSDGGSYRILSTGRDGLMDRDWSATAGSSAMAGTPTIAGDIVYGDGRLMVVTERMGGD
jgi:hypothetical protein